MTGGMVGQETVDGIVMEAKGFWIIGLLRALIGFGRTQSPTGSSARHWTPSAAARRCKTI